MTGVYTELENVYAGKSVSPLQGGSSTEPEGPGQTEAYGRSLSPLTLPPLTGTLLLTHTTAKQPITCTHTGCFIMYVTREAQISFYVFKLELYVHMNPQFVFVLPW